MLCIAVGVSVVIVSVVHTVGGMRLHCSFVVIVSVVHTVGGDAFTLQFCGDC